MNITPIKYAKFNNCTSKVHCNSSNKAPAQKSIDYSIYNNSSYSFMGIQKDHKTDAKKVLSVYMHGKKLSLKKYPTGKETLSEVFKNLVLYNEDMLSRIKNGKRTTDEGFPFRYEKTSAVYENKIIQQLKIIEKAEDCITTTTFNLDNRFHQTKSAEILKTYPDGTVDIEKINLENGNLEIQLGRKTTDDGVFVKEWYEYKHGKIKKILFDYTRKDLEYLPDDTYIEKAKSVYLFDENEKISQYMQKWGRNNVKKSIQEFAKYNFSFKDGEINTFDERYQLFIPDIISTDETAINPMKSVNHIDFSDLEKVKIYPVYETN